ncbi:bifunctional diaminohydroxyphosphoribosylaminopyrimidine deaminase/5-amino-6-(5-phosphoribosylamino)uracil reductase RibD [Syntrophomonas palmitatica]|uniref:bifunctional diaminohydroxyphosphoribosylaminopyrimidine deaminase/5-amino-6-(5-phosphoribosylamino)uracil reductase RibD n=1 Tax=Syntrophomonas palmitatica TaxID=402877 RepID=UPI00241C36EE|nr:bifunctional diaminohydroxyphosphoribosylaminopyrimidine deaminase/5-amino-6-(5-phosphoribosylamino)uracil reductase RibD [Syntrophomonas palmitatica]
MFLRRGIITEEDSRYMQRALELAAMAMGRTSPNPVVGAVIVKDGIIVGEGYHRQAGTPHAEIHALREAGEAARGSDVYVSLEPCSHYGRTPPCADALVKAGIKRAVIATVDPNPRVMGRGIKILQKAGIEVKTGILQNEAQKLNEFFFKYIRTGRPFVTVKTAMTLDGKIAASSGDSRWVSGEDSRRHVHELRNIYDAIMLGIGSVLKDDPQLNTRLDTDDTRDPLRVIIDRCLQIPLNSKIIQSSQSQATIIFCGTGASTAKAEEIRQAGAEVICLETNTDMIPLDKVLDELGHRGILSLLVEGGAQINANLIENKLADKYLAFVAPKIAGGNKAPSPVGGRGVEFMNDAVMLCDIEYRFFEKDILISGYFRNELPQMDTD